MLHVLQRASPPGPNGLVPHMAPQTPNKSPLLNNPHSLRLKSPPIPITVVCESTQPLPLQNHFSSSQRFEGLDNTPPTNPTEDFKSSQAMDEQVERRPRYYINGTDRIRPTRSSKPGKRSPHMDREYWQSEDYLNELVEFEQNLFDFDQTVDQMCETLRNYARETQHYIDEDYIAIETDSEEDIAVMQSFSDAPNGRARRIVAPQTPTPQSDVEPLNPNGSIPRPPKMGFYLDGCCNGTEYNRPLSYPDSQELAEFRPLGIVSKVHFQDAFVKLQVLLSLKGWTFVGKTTVATLYNFAIMQGKLLNKREFVNAPYEAKGIPLTPESIKLLKFARKFAPYAGPKLRALLEELRPSKLRKLAKDPTTSEAIFQMFASARAKVAGVSLFADLTGTVGTVLVHFAAFRHAAYTKITSFLGVTLDPFVTKILDVISSIIFLVMTINLFKLVVRVVDKITKFILSLFFETIPHAIAETVRYCISTIVDWFNVNDDDAEMQSPTTTVVTAVACLIGTIVTGAPMSMKTCAEFARLVNPMSSIVDAFFTNATVFSKWLIAKICPDAPFVQDQIFIAEYEALRTRALERQEKIANLADLMRSSAELRKVTHDDYIWMLKHSDKLRSYPEFVRTSMLIVDTLKLCKEHYSISLMVSGMSDKPQPLCVLLPGLPNQGKTQVITLLCKYIHDKMAKSGVECFVSCDNDSMHIYQKSSSTPYWEGYTAQPFYVCDDAFQDPRTECLAEEANEIIHCVNVSPYPLNYANVDMKGKNFFCSKIVFVTTNFEDFIKLPLTSPAALSRRFSHCYRVTRVSEIPRNKDVKISDLNLAWTFKTNDNMKAPGGSDFKLSTLKDTRKGELCFEEVADQLVKDLLANLSATPMRDRFILPTGVDPVFSSVSQSTSTTSSSSDSEQGNFMKIEDELIELQMFSSFRKFLYGEKAEEVTDSIFTSSSETESDSFEEINLTLEDPPSEERSSKIKSWINRYIGDSANVEACKIVFEDFLNVQKIKALYWLGIGATVSDAPFICYKTEPLDSAKIPDYVRKLIKVNSLHVPDAAYRLTTLCPFKLQTDMFGTQTTAGDLHFQRAYYNPQVDMFGTFIDGVTPQRYQDMATWVFRVAAYIRTLVWDLSDRPIPVSEEYQGDKDEFIFASELLRLLMNNLACRDIESYSINSVDLPRGCPPVLFKEQYLTEPFYFLVLAGIFPQYREIRYMYNIWRENYGLETVSLKTIKIYHPVNDHGLWTQVTDPKKLTAYFRQKVGNHFTPEKFPPMALDFVGRRQMHLIRLTKATGVDAYDIYTSLGVLAGFVLGAGIFLSLTMPYFGTPKGRRAQALFHSKEPGNDGVPGNDEGQSSMSRNKKAARLAKGEGHDPNVMYDEEQQHHVVKRRGNRRDASTTEWTMQGFNTHARALAYSNSIMVVKIVRADGSESYSQVFFLDGRQIAAPWHVFGSNTSTVLSLSFYHDHPDVVGIKSEMTITSELFSIHRPDKSRDLALIVLQKEFIGGMRNRWSSTFSRKKLPKKIEKVTRIVSGVVNGKKLVVVEGPWTGDYVSNGTKRFVFHHEGGLYEDTGLCYYNINEGGGVPGDCGFPYEIHDVNDGSLLGIHGARAIDNACVIPIFTEDNMITGGEMQGFPGFEESITSPNGTIIPGVSLVGETNIKGGSSPPFSKLQNHIPAPERYFPQEDIKYPAVMTRKAQSNRLDKTVNAYQKKYQQNYEKYTTPEFCKGFVSKQPSNLKFLTFEEALFGDPATELSSMASSSKYVGYAFDMPKSSLVNFETKTYHKSLKERVEAYIEMAKTQEIRPLATQFAKDEALAMEKIVGEECRLINGHDLAYNIFLRMITGRFVQFLVKDSANKKGTTALGINPLSHEWGLLYNGIATHGNAALEGDLSKEEAVTNFWMKEAFVNYMRSIYKLTKEEAIILKNGLAGLNGYYFVRDKHIYLTLGGHSSGHFLTTVFNSFCTWWLHKACFFSIRHKVDEMATFEDNVALKVTGDDSAGTVAEPFREVYNMSVLRDFCAELGIKYTPASQKEGEIVDFVNIENLTFLGRRFMRDTEGRILGPLRKVAINDMLIYTVPVPGLTAHEVLNLRYHQAFDEASLHGETYYNELQNLVYTIADDHRGKYFPQVSTYQRTKNKIFRNWYKSGFEGNDFKAPPAKALRQ